MQRYKMLPVHFNKQQNNCTWRSPSVDSSVLIPLSKCWRDYGSLHGRRIRLVHLLELASNQQRRRNMF